MRAWGRHAAIHVSSLAAFFGFAYGGIPFWWLCKHAMHLFEYRSVRSWSNEIDTTLSGGQKN
jgi:hypothetical protein